MTLLFFFSAAIFAIDAAAAEIATLMLYASYVDIAAIIFLMLSLPFAFFTRASFADCRHVITLSSSPATPTASAAALFLPATLLILRRHIRHYVSR